MRNITLLVPAGFAAGAIAVRALLLHPPHAIAVDLAQPIAVVTYWKSFGALMFAALAGAIAIASAGYIAALREPPPLRVTVALCAASCALAFAVPVIFSSDVYAYAAYGDLANRGISPYAHMRIAAPDPLLAAAIWQWGNPPPMCVYGPVFVWIAQIAAAFAAQFGPAAPLWFLRMLCALALVACAPLAYAAFSSSDPRRRLRAAAGIALNPVAIWCSAAGHNDAILLGAVLCGFAVAARRGLMGGAIVSLAALIKAPALAASAIAVLWWSRTAKRHAPAIVGTIAGAAAAIAVSAPLEFGVRTHLAPSGKYLPQFSLQYAFAAVLPVAAAVAAVALPCLALAIAGVRAVLRGKPDGIALIALAAWFAIPNPYPWYGLWILPAAFLTSESALSWAIISATLLAAFRLLPDATWAQFPAPAGIAVTAAAFATPIYFLIMYMRDLARRDRREDRIPVPDFARLRSP